MSLSHLTITPRNDLHVNTPSDLHRDFSRLHPGRRKITTSRVYALPLNRPDTKGNEYLMSEGRVADHPPLRGEIFTRLRETCFRYAYRVWKLSNS